MKRLLVLAFLLAATLIVQAADPLRVFIRSGESNRGQQAHAHPRFLAEWKKLLAERGLAVEGATDWPTAEQMAKTDVIVAYAQDGGNATPEQQKNLGDFTKRGGGLVIIHTAAVSNDPPWWKAVIGGAWVQGKTKWKEGPMDLYYTENQQIGGGHPITKGAANFQLDDEIYYDMDIAPEVEVLATAYTPKVKEGKKVAEGGKANIYDIQPQMWAYEKTAEGGTQPYRAFVSIPGHLFSTFEKPQYRAILLRGICWAGKRTNLDEFCKPEEISALTYPAGGPMRPEQTLKNLEIHPDFKMTLVTAEPLISKPMNFDWAPDGSLWVAETPEYPNGRRGMRPDYRGVEWKDHGGIDPTPGEQTRKAQDKISRLIDSNGDGVMDKKEVFYEGLDLVTGFVFHRDGVIVTQAPDILFLRDTDGDGKADKVEKLYTNLGINDTHAVINNPRWGWDGWIYATHGYSDSAKVLNAKGELQGKIGSGVVRFKPDGSAMEQYSSKGGNTWGLQITGDNRVMWTQPTSGQLLMQTVLPEYALARGKVGNTASFKVVEPSPKSFPLMTAEQLAYVQIDWVGSFTAAAGCAIYDGGAWPQEYNGDYFTTEPTINLIHHTRLTPDGSSYKAAKLPGREETEFVRSKDMWWRPIEVRVGPDGALYVGDFYNQAVIHNDTRGPDHNKVNAAVRPDRDHYFGRIWKIEHKDAKKLAVPDLAKVGSDELIKQLGNPNRPVRMTASRLLGEYAAAADATTRGNIQFNFAATTRSDWGKLTPEAKIARLWTLVEIGGVTPELLTIAGADADANIRRNAALAMESFNTTNRPTAAATRIHAPGLLTDPDAQVRVAGLRAYAAGFVNDEAARAVIAAWPKFDDDFQKTAAIGVASRNPAAAIAAALQGPDPASLAPLVSQLVSSIGEKGDTAAASTLVVTLAAAPASADPLKRSILDAFSRSLKQVPAMTPELSTALGKLLASGASSSALPLAAKWDKAGALKPTIDQLIGTFATTLRNAQAADDARLSAAQSLVGLRTTNPQILPTVVGQLAAEGSPGFKRALITALGETDDASVGTALAAAYGKLPADVQPAAFDAVLKRTDWANAFLDAMKSKQIDAMTLGPANTARLRTHPDRAIAKRATEMLDELNPMAKMKKETIAKLAPVVEQKGDVAKGKVAFQTTCAICHKFGEVGADVGPALTGMGSHGAGELLSAIVDPNAEVDPSFVTWNFETKDGQFVSGVIAAENPASVTVKSLAGVQEVKVANLKSRVNTARSLMPEGFEGLGGETVRDIIAYMQSVDGGKFRTVDLKDAFTVSSARGFYADEGGKSLDLAKTGTLTFGGVPFNVVPPEKSATGLNVVQLQGGPDGSFARTKMPVKVEAKLGGFTANRLHFLGGTGGWAFPFEKSDMVVMKASVRYTDGNTETFQFRNGVEIADYISRNDVPGSAYAEGLARGQQVRWFSKQLSKAAPIEKIILESTGTIVAPTLVAVTAELADANAKPLAAQLSPKAGETPAPLPTAFVPQFNDPVPEPPAARPANGPRVLIVGGGSSHDFVKFFGGTDKATLAPLAGWVDFTQNLNGIAPILDRVDVLVLSANQPISSPTKKALIDYANRGGAIIAHHPGTWYAWNNFAQWNKEIVGGGSRGHDKFGEFEVSVTGHHPILEGVPASFKITDELYYFQPDASGTPIEILATATSTQKPGTYPQVWIVQHPKARIVGLTLGHDAQAHDLPAYQTLLKNAVRWCAAK